MSELAALCSQTENGEAARPSARADAMKAIVADREASVKACGEALSPLLEQHGCALAIQHKWADGIPLPLAKLLEMYLQAQIVIVARD